MDLVSALEFLKLNIIPQAWVDEVWDLEFTEKTPLDDAIEEELTASDKNAFRNLYQCLLTHTAEQQQSTDTDAASQSIWALLTENEVSVKSLVAVLSFFVLSGKSKTATVQQRVSGLHAASLYLLLLGLPGSIANKVFHEVFLDTCSNMTFHCWPQDSGKKRKKEIMKSSQADNKRSKRHRKDCQEVDMDEAEEDDEEEEPHFTGRDLENLRAAVVLLVQSLLRLLQTLPLKGRPQTANNCTQIFSKLLYFEPVIGDLDFTAEDFTQLRSVPAMAFYGLQLLCSPKHGNEKESLRRVFHRLLYVILMMNKGNRGKPTVLIPNQANLAIRNQAIQFVCHIVSTLNNLALPFLQILLQHICFQMVEKSEFRNHGAQAVGTLTAQMASTDYASFIKWLYNYSRHSKMVCRLFSVDVVMVLLEQPERQPEDCGDPELVHFLPHKFLIQNLLFAQRNDESPVVQGHAFACLAQCLELPSLNATRAVHALFSTSGSPTVLDGGEITEGTISSQQTQKTYRSLPFRTVEFSSTETTNSEAKENLALLLQRVQDPKTNVRKSALQALVSLLKHNVILMSSENLFLLSERCRDPAVSVKKKALQCVGDLLNAKPDSCLMQKAWLQGVVPAVIDSENSVQEKALEALDQVLLSQVKLYSAGRHLDTAQTLTWDLLNLLCNDCHNLSRYFSRAFTIWSKQNRFTPTFINNLISHTETDHAGGAWLLLTKVVASSPKLSYGKILDAWDNTVMSKDKNVTTCCHILSVIGDIAAHLNEETTERIINDLMSLVKTTLSLELISAAMETLYQLGHSEDVKQTQAFLNQYCGELVSISEAYLASIIMCENGAQSLNEELMIKHLHTLGVASLHCPAKISKRTVLLVESVLTANSDKLADFQEELPPSLPLSQFKTNCFSTRVRAHGVITLGKLCLQREELVQKYLPVFARELEVGTEVAVRNNVVVVMCDLCVRYTNIGDHYIPNISACLQDSQPVIREQTLIMLTNLLQEEFVKWKGSLFFRFVVALVDPVPAISSLCEYCLLHLLLKKNPEMFSQHFIECFFHFNSYNKHKTYNKFPQSETQKVQFSLKGSQNREKRFQIYRFLLEHFTDVQRFNVMNKINQSVLAYFADEELPLDEDGSEILSETFSILSLKEMKLQAVSASAAGSVGGEPEEENVATVAKAVLEAAQKKVVSQIQKKAFIENTVPLIISLKNLLEQRRSPVLRELMAYLKVKMEDYRTEVKEFFPGDEQLAAEVEFALKMTENEQKMEEKMAHCNLTGETQTSNTQASVQQSPTRPRAVSLLSFTTPQPRRAPSLFKRLVYTARCQGSVSVVHKGADNRAISTPKGVDVHLTFNDVSPIFRHSRSSSLGDSNDVHVQSDQQQAPGLRQWNVQSPLRQKKKKGD